MAIAAPTQIGTLINSNTAAQTTMAIGPGTFPAGSLGVMLIAISGAAVNAGITVVDNAGAPNTWTVAAAADNNGGAAGVHTAIAYFYYASAATVTVTATFASCNMRFGWCGYVTGTTTTPFDQPGTAAPAASTSVTVTTTGNLAVNAEIGFVAVSLQSNGAGQPTTWPTAGWTTLGNPTDATRTRAAAFSYQILTAGAGSTLSSGSIPYTTSSLPAASIATFKPAATATVTPPRPTVLLQAVNRSYTI